MQNAIELSCVSHGVRFQLHLQSAELIPLVSEVLPHDTHTSAIRGDEQDKFMITAQPRRAGYRLLVGTELKREHCTLTEIADELRHELMLHVATHSPQYVFVHAAVVAWHGRALLLPGRSFAGKSTLTAALLRQGAVYYSDEFAVLSADGKVHPYSRPLQIRAEGTGTQHSVPWLKYGRAAGISAIPVACVAFTRYEQGTTWCPVQMTQGMAALELLQHAIPIQRTPARVVTTLRSLLLGATCLKSMRGEAEEAAGRLLDWVKGKNPNSGRISGG